MILHKDLEVFRNAIQVTSQGIGVREIYVEKDYWVTLVLKRLANSEFKNVAIFKGGTSLSKAIKCIERFSEDIDLAVITGDKNGNQIKKLISKIQKEITKDLPEIEVKGLTSKGAKFRKTVHEYKKITSERNFGQAMDKLLLEINSFATPTPNSSQEIESYIATFLSNNNKGELIEKYQLEPFNVLVLNTERTFAEKIMGLIRASYQENPEEELKNKIRHIYDINRILQLEKMRTFLNSDDFFSMINNVKKDDSSNSQFKGDWLNYRLSSSLIFKDVEKIWDSLKHSYNEDFRPFVFGELPSATSIKHTLLIVAQRLSEFDKMK